MDIHNKEPVLSNDNDRINKFIESWMSCFSLSEESITALRTLYKNNLHLEGPRDLTLEEMDYYESML